MRQEVIDLDLLGPLPSSEIAIRDRLESRLDEYAKLIDSIQKPITDEEAKVLVRLFGPDDCFGVAWSLLHLIETAPGWPLQDVQEDRSNEWIERLRQRAARGRAPQV